MKYFSVIFIFVLLATVSCFAPQPPSGPNGNPCHYVKGGVDVNQDECQTDSDCRHSQKCVKIDDFFICVDNYWPPRNKRV